MAEYKVPQDVEAEDKLLGPFSFRQFIYLIVAAIGIFLMWALGQIFIGLAILPFPVVAFFLVLALPLRKDQPMEAYLLAMVQFFLKPKIRYWNPDGSVTQVEITAPPVTEQQLTKDFSGEQASERLAYLARVIDTGGWAARGVTGANDSLNDITMAEAQHAEDVMDDSSGVGQSFDQLISSSDSARKQAMITQLQQSIHQPSATSSIVDRPSSNPSAVHYDPYPSSMHQRVIKPSSQSGQDKPADAKPKAATAAKASAKAQPASPPSPAQPSPDIIRLANNKDLSISALAREAHRVSGESDDNEVVISLR